MFKKTILVVFGILLVIIFSKGVLSQEDPGVLESRLSEASGKDRLAILVELAKLYQVKDLGKAYSYGEKALELNHRFPNTTDETNLLNLMATVAIKLGNYPAGIRYSNRAAGLAKKSGNEKYYAAAIYNLGFANKYLAHYHEAVNYFSDAQALYKKLGDMKMVAGCFNQMGLVYRRLSDFSKALDLIFEAGKIYIKLDEKDSLASIYNNIGIIYDEMGNLDLALEYYKKSLEIDKKQKDYEGIAIAEMNVAGIYGRQKKYNEAMELYKRALATFEKLGSKKNISNVLLSIGENFEMRNNLQSAIKFYTRGKKIKEETGEFYGTSDSYMKLGGIYRKLGHYPQALEYLLKGLELSKKIDYQTGIRDSNFELSTLYREIADYPKALEYYTQYKETNDLIFNEKNSRRITELQVRFDLELKEKEITLLKKDQQIQSLRLERQTSLIHSIIVISVLILILAFVVYKRYRLKVRVNLELMRYREQLSELVEERTRELKEAQGELVRSERLSVLGQLTATVAHEIRNPLGTARTSIYSIEKSLKNNNIDRVRQAAQLAERNIVRCDNIIGDLLDFTRRRELRFEDTQIDAWLENILNERTFPEGIACERKLKSGIEIPVDRERLLRAVINVLNNAVDALQEKGAAGKKLTVGSIVSDHRLEIRITDMGAGIPAEHFDKIFEPLFSTKRFGFGLGLSVVKNIMIEHSGGVDIRSRVGQGTTVTLWLPQD